ALAAVGQREHDVGALDDPEIAVRGVGRMEKERGRPGAGQRGGNLPADNPRLPDPGHDHAPGAVEDEPHRGVESLVEAVDERQDGTGLDRQHPAREREIGDGPLGHARAPERAVAGWRAASSIRVSLSISGSSNSSRSALAASLRARAGSSCTSMNTPSTPAATPAAASGSMYSARPAVTPSPAPGSCRLWVTSKITGYPSSRSMGNARMSTTRLLYPKLTPRSVTSTDSFP